MENKNHDPDAAAHHVIAKPENESKKSGVFAAIRHLLETPKPAIKALFALAEVQSPSPPPPQHESLRNAGISGPLLLTSKRLFDSAFARSRGDGTEMCERSLTGIALDFQKAAVHQHTGCHMHGFHRIHYNFLYHII